MAGKADFTPDEWATLQRALLGAPLLVAVADGGRSDLLRELERLRDRLEDVSRGHGSQLVQELADVSGAHTGFSAGMTRAEVEGPALQALRVAADLLQYRAPDEVDSFKAFVLELAADVAGAARSHLFGLAGPRVSDAEASVVDRIRAAMDLG
jgi:hypothetical protein